VGTYPQWGAQKVVKGDIDRYRASPWYILTFVVRTDGIRRIPTLFEGVFDIAMPMVLCTTLVCIYAAMLVLAPEYTYISLTLIYTRLYERIYITIYYVL